jgi:hypothetical protein
VLDAATPEKFKVDSDQGAVELAYDDVLAASTVFRWEKAPKPGH